jgi:hypothetical protein
MGSERVLGEPKRYHGARLNKMNAYLHCSHTGTSIFITISKKYLSSTTNKCSDNGSTKDSSPDRSLEA